MQFTDTVRRTRDYFATGVTRPPAFRQEQLQKLAAALQQHEPAIFAALQADLGRSPYQSFSSELGLVHAEINHALRHLARWTAPATRRTPWLVAPARGWVQAEPFGVALIVGPWNYPVQLLLAPLVSAIAAGNAIILKPSELAPRTAEALTTMIGATFPGEYITAVNGGPEVAEALLQEKFDKIFFTGSPRVGRVVMAAAARHLTPVTLELGGKCPAVVCADAKVELAARRIVWGKFLGAGQTCVAPDHVRVHRSIREPFLQEMKKALLEFYGPDPRRSSDYGRIVNQRHFTRLVNYLGDGKIFHGGDHDAQELYLVPTILIEVRPDAPVTQEEIFGPVLPVLDFDDLTETVTQLQAGPTPLALSLFTEDRMVEQKLISEVRSGGVCVNDVMSHMIGTGLPFGGLGESGFGSYHGRAGFDAFSHQRSVLRRGTWLDLPFRYPPQRFSIAALKRSLKFLLRG
ncbi:MAG TPA: aldehyde dehydrogenase [bacterium]|nr:aldehyde dehydrogenase [bacterium]